MKKKMGIGNILALCFTFIASAVTNANAAITWTGISLNTADLESWMMLVIPGLAVLWGLRKVIKIGNRS